MCVVSLSPVGSQEARVAAGGATAAAGGAGGAGGGGGGAHNPNTLPAGTFTN